ncbi:hypothetical protein [Mesobacillus zeae]|uniref:Uncharacterized protein n=1 Tax=Mesobacillus zeae TaxID=1917180 RepID=A0A398AVX0_9BACI|nr:hypothetical protein [Mesobacillus zeae]RID81735.1 hypothetical protein D1970_21015 [Mesobacillus zeae]
MTVFPLVFYLFLFISVNRKYSFPIVTNILKDSLIVSLFGDQGKQIAVWGGDEMYGRGGELLGLVAEVDGWLGRWMDGWGGGWMVEGLRVG